MLNEHIKNKTITIPKVFNIHNMLVEISVAKAKYRARSIPWGLNSIDWNTEKIESHYLYYTLDSTWFLADYNKGYPRQGQKSISPYLTDTDLNNSIQCEYMSSEDSTKAIPSGYLAADFCRSNNMYLPTIDTLVRVYQYKDYFDNTNIDETLIDYPQYSIDNILLYSLNIWSSTVGDTSHTWMIRSMGKVGYGRRHYPAGVVPVLERIIS